MSKSGDQGYGIFPNEGSVSLQIGVTIVEINEDLYARRKYYASDTD